MVKWWHYKARRIMAEHIGRSLSIFEVVHHIDKNERNNSISNLQLMTPEEHASLHRGSFGVKHKVPSWNKLPEEKIIEIIKLSKQNLSYMEISRRLGISNMCVRNYVLGLQR